MFVGSLPERNFLALKALMEEPGFEARLETQPGAAYSVLNFAKLLRTAHNRSHATLAPQPQNLQDSADIGMALSLGHSVSLDEIQVDYNEMIAV